MDANYAIRMFNYLGNLEILGETEEKLTLISVDMLEIKGNADILPKEKSR